MWSVPLSLAISTITAVLIGKFFSLTAVVFLFLLLSLLWIATLAKEWLRLRRSRSTWTLGMQPLGIPMLIMATLLTAIVVLSLVDFQSGQRLFMSLTFYDHGARVNWAESVLRSGIPPTNPYYYYQHAANLRYYYFWLVDCAAVAKISHLSVRAVVAAGCVWAGFCMVSVIGLYLKHFLEVGARLRAQFLLAVSLLGVGGLTVCVNFWNMLYLQKAAPGDAWAGVQIPEWLSFLLFYPHHLVSMLCCMFALLLASIAGKAPGRGSQGVTVTLIAAALASAFGLSVYVAFAFFLLMLVWGLWQVAIERSYRPALLLATGGAGAGLLLLPYLWELTHTTSMMYGGSVFALSVREMIPSEGLLASSLFQHLAASHQVMAQDLARLILLPPAYAIELGFYCVVLLIYLVPAWHGRMRLTSAQKSLMVMIATTLPIMSFIRSDVLLVNDFGIHSGLFLQFPLLLLASELLISWRFDRHKISEPPLRKGLPRGTPNWLRSLAALVIIIGIFSTVYKACALRFILPISAANAHNASNPDVANLPHKAYISYLGYAQLDAAIPRDAIVQFNVTDPWPFWKNVDLINIDHQTAIAGGVIWCGSELGGDPSGCPEMIAAIEPIFKDATAEQARATCHRFGIQYLVANIYDPAWNDKSGWVWTLSPVLSDQEFRALDCR